jgi:hypothetical protein
MRLRGSVLRQPLQRVEAVAKYVERDIVLFGVD